MVDRMTYVPPAYIPIGQSDAEAEVVPSAADVVPVPQNGTGRWSSGICACFDDMQSCCLVGFPGCFVACYACGYRKTLRSKYNLEEASCGDFVTHFLCHLCAVCQEHREICVRSQDSISRSLDSAQVRAPTVQTIESGPPN